MDEKPQSAIAVGLAATGDEDFRRAALPLFEAGLVEALSWSFEATWDRPGPEWLELLVDYYASQSRLTLHGLALSPLSARPDLTRRTAWLAGARAAAQPRKLTHASEHFGFCAAGNFVFGAPLPVPWSQAALAAGHTALDALGAATGCVPGLENLALSWSASDALSHGAYMHALIGAREDAFVVLDLHNLICQATTFDLDVDALLAAYPLARVRELHVAGGRTVEALPGTRPVRRDTHDQALAEDVLALVPRVLARAPNVRFVFLERLPGTLANAADRTQLARDFEALVAQVRAAAEPGARAPSCSEHDRRSALGTIIEDDAYQLHALQISLLEALAHAPDAVSVQRSLLHNRELSPYHAWIAQAELRMLETSRELVRRWSVQAAAPAPHDGAG